MKNITILGTGAMGARLANNLLDAGYDVTLWNRTAAKTAQLRERGASVAATPADAAREAEIVMSLLSDDTAARAAWLHPEQGACSSLRADAIAIESSSTTPGWSRELSAAVEAGGAGYLEAPVVGSRPQAEAGQLIQLVGGDAEVLQRVRAVFEVSAAAVIRVGDVGAAMSAKLAVNLLFASQVAALAETLGALTAAGLGDRETLALLAELPTTSPALKGVGALIAARNFEPLFPIDLVVKDLGYYQQMAAGAGVDTPLAASVREVYLAAQGAGFGGDNIAGVARLRL